MVRWKDIQNIRNSSQHQQKLITQWGIRDVFMLDRGKVWALGIGQKWSKPPNKLGHSSNHMVVGSKRKWFILAILTWNHSESNLTATSWYLCFIDIAQNVPKLPTVNKHWGRLEDILQSDGIEVFTPKVFPLVNRLTEEFMKYDRRSPMLKFIWTEMMFLSFYRQADCDYLRDIHKSPAHDNFFHAIVIFHHQQSRDRSTRRFNSHMYHNGKLSTQLANIQIHESSDILHGLYQHYSEFIHGESHVFLSLHMFNLIRIPFT